MKEHWYVVSKIVLTYCEKKNVLVIKIEVEGQEFAEIYKTECFFTCSWRSNTLRKKIEAEGREFAKFLRSLEQNIQTVKGQNNFR